MIAGLERGLWQRSHVVLVTELNRRFAWNSRIELFHHPDDDPVAGINLPPVRGREAEFSQTPERFLMPDGPSEAFKRVMSDVPEPPHNAKPPRFESG